MPEMHDFAAKNEICVKIFKKNLTSDWDMYLPLGLGMDILEERVSAKIIFKKMKNEQKTDKNVSKRSKYIRI